MPLGPPIVVSVLNDAAVSVLPGWIGVEDPKNTLGPGRCDPVALFTPDLPDGLRRPLTRVNLLDDRLLHLGRFSRDLQGLTHRNLTLIDRPDQFGAARFEHAASACDGRYRHVQQHARLRLR